MADLRLRRDLKLAARLSPRFDLVQIVVDVPADIDRAAQSAEAAVEVGALGPGIEGSAPRAAADLHGRFRLMTVVRSIEHPAFGGGSSRGTQSNRQQ